MVATVSAETPRLLWPQSPPPARLAGPQVPAERRSLSMFFWVFSIVGHTTNTSRTDHLRSIWINALATSVDSSWWWGAVAPLQAPHPSGLGGNIFQQLAITFVRSLAVAHVRVVAWTHKSRASPFYMPTHRYCCWSCSDLPVDLTLHLFPHSWTRPRDLWTPPPEAGSLHRPGEGEPLESLDPHVTIALWPRVNTLPIEPVVGPSILIDWHSLLWHNYLGSVSRFRVDCYWRLYLNWYRVYQRV